jgi:hypothetical protein
MSPQASLPFRAYTNPWATVLEAMILKLGKAIRGAALPSFPLYIRWNIDLIKKILSIYYLHILLTSLSRELFQPPISQHTDEKEAIMHGWIKNSSISWRKTWEMKREA